MLIFVIRDVFVWIVCLCCFIEVYVRIDFMIRCFGGENRREGDGGNLGWMVNC